MHLGVMTNILEVLHHCLGDIDLLDGHAQTLHQGNGILVGTVGGAESGHGHAKDSLAR